MLIAPIRLYQLTLSPMLGNVCRFTPSCSRYAVEALERFGPVKGLYLATRRILRCNPWHEGGVDPVPELYPGRLRQRCRPGHRHPPLPDEQE